MENNLDAPQILKLLDSDDQFAQDMTESIEANVKRSSERMVMIESAIAMSQSEKKTLEDSISQRLFKPLTYKYAVKPEILGGFRITIGDLIFDSSLETRLKKLQQYLT